MEIRNKIETIFGERIFEGALFYDCPGGLRFKLSEGGHYLNQFLTAHRKGMEICGRVFTPEQDISVCFKIFGQKTLSASFPVIRELSEMGLFVGKKKEHWTEFEAEWKDDEDYANCLWHYVAFNVPIELLPNIFWCAFSSDFGVIQPNPGVRVYLFNFKKEIMIYPYDDRGMDIVGPNKTFLKELYDVFNEYLLDYDREAMDAVFSTQSS